MVTEQLKEDFRLFRDQAMELRHLVNTFQKLYEADVATLQLLSAVAEAFFRDLNRWLVELYIMKVARLTDPAATGAKENLSAERLVNDLKEADCAFAEIEALLKKLQTYRSSHIDLPRHKVVAHADRELLRNPNPLGEHTPREFEDFLENLQRFCDLVGTAVEEGPLDFCSQPERGDVVDLIRKLRRLKQI